MKKAFVLIISLSLLLSCDQNESKPKESLPAEKLSSDLVNIPQSKEKDTALLKDVGCLQFKDTIHDFGQIAEGEMIQYEFTFKNIGSKEVIITDAKGSCGCTVPRYDKKPMAPGEERTMEVTFNSKGKPGYNEKHITINTNAQPSEYRLTILANVK